MLTAIFDLDKKLFLWMNHFHWGFLDEFIIFISEDYYFALILIPFFWLAWRKKKKFFRSFLLFSLISFGLSDVISSKVIKPSFKRKRPCHEKEIKDQAHLSRLRCGGKYGFVSSHASNGFAVAAFLYFFLKKDFAWAVILFPLSAILALTRIYLAKHYPLDLFFGALLGFSIGASIFFFYNKLILKRKL